ncbi:N-acetylglucosaminyl-diphospho-decaprenol L-rhamnosyltransferase [Herbihabitans rhizosphaerae]|uniref:N-acetylglucosaminyl-diphospho-decaprenol L-rhamnosyltransferase n=1 Tax=Herbihabitans rhizosphaerae TaxID=1872711 RepID=A0A4Q7KI82_9PSEU|nr:glycosyltransferase family 2 protein [Herbihabitans rhizosphaerae]RZS33905.1 N-acetylglucosaminyl-diphospho-decaprenol L-rhamnosyltransferase [Herbihabitans rhizosphaerae]
MTEPTQYGDEIGVVTVTYSPGDVLTRFLDTLGKASTRQVRVVLADNGSTDGAPEREAERDGVTLVPTGENLGYGGGANRGVAAFGEDVGWIVVANPDIEWGEGSLDELVAAAKRWPRGGSFGPLIREPNGEVYPSARLLPSLGKGIGHALLGRVWPRNPWTTAYRQSDTDVTERAAGWLSGSCLLLRREAFDSVGGFDPRYFMYFEDVDLGDRLGKAGWHNVYVPSAEVVHIGGHATARASAKMLAVHHDSAYRYLADRHQGWRWAPVLAAIRAGLTVRLKLQTRGN